MTVSTTISRVTYNGDGETYTFPYTFRVIESSHLYVIYTNEAGEDTIWVENTEYTVTNVNEESGGNVIVEEAYIPEAGTKLTIYRDIPETQETDYVENDPFHADTVETDFDRTIMIIQQLSDGLDRCIQISRTDDSEPDLILPSREERADKYLGFDLDGDITVYSRHEDRFYVSQIINWENEVLDVIEDTGVYVKTDGTRPFIATIAGVTPTDASHLTTKGYVDNLAQGLDWQKSVLSKTTAYGSAVASGTNRYISPTTSGAWTADHIYEWDPNENDWDDITPNEGYTVWVEDVNQLWTYNGSNIWVQFGTLVSTLYSDINLNGYNINFGTILTTSGTYSGEIMTVTVDDANTVFGDILYQGADFHYDRANADSISTAPGFVVAVENGSGSKKVLLRGQVCKSGWGLSAGKLYLTDYPGAVSNTQPYLTGQIIQPMGWALSSVTMFFSGSVTHGEAL